MHGIRITSFILVCIGLAACGSVSDNPMPDQRVTQEGLDRSIAELVAEYPAAPGFAIAVIDNGALVSAANGVAAPDGRAMTADTPVRIASITKTFVAAAALRLWEEGRLDLDAPISGLISPKHDQLLQADGYDTKAITVKQLLMHAGGLADHFGSDNFKDAVLADLSRVWTRTDQLQMMVDTTEPLAGPGAEFHYSDTGYLLVGEIIERITGQPLGSAVRELNKFDEIGLTAIRWEGEAAPQGDQPARAHQYLGPLDTHPIDGSVDAFGGGGLIASVQEVARYYEALFSGRIFQSPATLEFMTDPGDVPQGSPYRLGLFVRPLGDQPGFAHGGFWGTDVVAYPELDLVVSGVALEQGGTKGLWRLASDIAQSVLTQSD